MVEDNAIQEFVDAIKEPEQDTNRTYSAIVSRVDQEGTVWVHLVGSEKETPTASTSTEVQKGDAVTVEWRNNKLYIAGNYSNPAVGMARVVNVEMAAQVANQAAQNAVADAGRAREAANHAEEVAEGVEAIAESAKTAADTAFTNLSQVQSVLEVAQWIATHGTYVKATVFNPNATYYTITATQVAEPSDDDKDSQGVLIYYELDNGIYVRTTDTSVDEQKTYYRVTGTPVAQPSAEHIADYYTLAVSEAMADYVQSHLALTDDGLYVMKDDSEWRVKIADDGVYILDPSDTPANQMTANGNVIGYEDETHIILQGNAFEIANDYNLKSVVILGGLTEGQGEVYKNPIYPETSITLELGGTIKRNSQISARWQNATAYFSEGIADEQTVGGVTFTYDGIKTITFNSVEGSVDSAVVGYISMSAYGSMLIDGVPGQVSGKTAFSLGNNTVSGDFSAALGEGCVSSRKCSFSFGSHCEAGYANTFVIGRYNDNQYNTAFEIGNGSRFGNSNAFTVDWNGKVECGNYQGKLTSLIDLTHPKGSTYGTVLPPTINGHSYDDGNLTDADIDACGDTWFDPRIMWGGTWAKLPEGYILLSGSESGSYQVGTGQSTPSGFKEYGANEKNITVRNMPSHDHAVNASDSKYFLTIDKSPDNAVSRRTIKNGTGSSLQYNLYSENAITRTSTTGSRGSGSPFDVMQKSIAVYTWIRTA